MYQLSDKNLDRLSREASEHVDPELNNAGWENMERLLDKELPQNKKDRRRFFLFLLFIALISGSGLVTAMINGQKEKLRSKTAATEKIGTKGEENNAEKIISGNTENDPSTPEKIIAENTESSADNIIPGNTASSPDKIVSKNRTTAPSSTPADVPGNAQNISAPDKQAIKNVPGGIQKIIAGSPNTEQPTGLVKKQHASQKNILAPTIIAGRKIKNSSAGPSSSIIKEKKSLTAEGSQNNSSHKNSGRKSGVTTAPKANPPAANDNPLQQDNVAGTQPLLPTIPPPSITDPPDSKDQRLTAQQPVPAPTVVPLPKNKAASTVSAVQQKASVPADSIHTIDSSAQAAKIKKKNKRSSSFDIGITAGPDLSTVKYHYTDNAGFNAGIRIGYHLNDRWSLHSGIIYTQKNYSAKGKDFHPPKDYWTNSYYIHKVEGNCFMLDIPLNVRYNITTSQKNKFFVSSGLSTYLMSKETYQYDYTLNGVMTRKDWTNYKNSHFIFSILNVSAGFEKAINKRFSIEAEPYAKVPLKGVGFGNMQMSSYGIYFSLIYKPSKK